MHANVRPLFIELTYKGNPVRVNVCRIGWFLPHQGIHGAVVRVAGIEGGLDVDESYEQICTKLAAGLRSSGGAADGAVASELSASPISADNGTAPSGRDSGD